MSERSERGPSESSNKDSSIDSRIEQVRSPSTLAASSQTWPNVSSATSSDPQRRVGNPGRPFELPPLPSSTNITAPGSSASVTRVGGVSSILNPVHGDEGPPNRRRKASHLDSPASSTHSLPPLSSSSQTPSLMTARLPQSPAAQYQAPVDRPPRRILTPRSPSLHRAASLGLLNSSAGTINAQTNPFPSSPRGRSYIIEPGAAGAPPLPTSPPAVRPPYGFSAPTPPTQAARRASVGAARPRGPSSSASPSTSYSSYSQIGQTSPATQYEPPMQAAPTTFPSRVENALSEHGTASAPPSSIPREHQRQLGIPISSSGGQNVYQMLTLETTSGTVQLPVDVQAASRVADEKRRRNAGASARFRQRRKEKEKEAATSISRLEQQVKELSEDAAFYRSEREYLINVLRHIPGGERHFPRPASPRHRRGSTAPLSAQPGVEAGYASSLEQGRRSPEEGRNVRRRPSNYSLPLPAQPLPMPPPHGVAIQPGYGPMPPHPPPSTLQSPSGPLPSPHLRGTLPPPSQMASGPASQHPQGPPSVLQALPQTGPFNPYAPARRSSGPPSQQRDGQ